MIKRLLLAAAALLALPATANAQSDWFSSTYRTYPGVYIGAQGGANWLLNNQSYIMDTGWTVGGRSVTTSSARVSSWRACTIPTPAAPLSPFRPATPR